MSGLKSEDLFANSYSFSGSDAKVVCFFPDRPDLMKYLESVHTVSVSVHEAKSQVRSLGYRGSKGMTRSIRTIAGSLILTVISDHPMRPLLDQYTRMMSDIEDYTEYPFGWSVDRDELGKGTFMDIYNFKNRLSSLLPPFNLLMEFVSENSNWIDDPNYPLEIWEGNRQTGKTADVTAKNLISPRRLIPGAGVMISGIEIIDESFVVSTNDMVTEITCSYVARDFKPISKQMLYDGIGPISISEYERRQMQLHSALYPAQWKERDTSIQFGQDFYRDWTGYYQTLRESGEF